MKRGSVGENIMGPMFPRLHVNDTEKGGPRAPPRNKMALYEQLSIPSQRFNHVIMPQNPNNNTACSVSPSSMGGGNDRGLFSARLVHRAYPSEKQYSQYSELRTTPAQVEQRKKVDDDDYRVVPIFIQPIPAEFDKYSKGLSNLSNSVDRLRPDDRGQPELCSGSRHLGNSPSIAAKRNSSSSEKALGGHNIVVDLSYDSGSGEDASCRSANAGSSEGDDNVSETSILDTESALEITPDHVVGALSQKHFWTARRAIMNQQRVFAVQIFELHRLIKVQRLIAASPHLLHDDTAFVDNPMKLLPAKKRPLNYASNAVSNIDSPSDKKEHSAENTVDKPPHSSSQNGVPAGSDPLASVVSIDHSNSRTSYFNHPPPQGHQWLIPMMSPSEGLVYKPCPAPGFVSPPGSNPILGNFLAPVYGIPTPSPQHPFPPFPPYGPHGYFPHYGMPVMAPSRNRNSGTVPKETNRREAEEIESSLSESRQSASRVSNSLEGRDVLRLFPTSSPASNGSKSRGQVMSPKHGPRVIKVVPHNAISASESAARIFQSIQEERKQYDSV